MTGPDQGSTPGIGTDRGSTPSASVRVELVPYDPAWPAAFEREADRIRGCLGIRCLLVEHTGSTSVPGLAAKPIIDITLVVPDTRDEPAYVPALEAAGYALRIREPDWYEHRLFKGPDTNVNVHTFSAGCFEIDRMIRFRDRLRSTPSARDRYVAVKVELARREWPTVQAYADAKTEIIEAILSEP
jgi:GrpB-like predicted nucleotidyltransferase (UPF0157 family)